MVDRPKVLAGILYSGEPTLHRAIGALEAQKDIDLRIVLIGGFGQWEAHRRLYRTFNETGPEVDLFVKVDADMIILHDRLLISAHRFLSVEEPVDRLTFGVHDWLSGQTIIGLHCWRSSVQWTAEPPPLHTDLVENTARARFVLKDPPEPLVLHAPDPDELQAARYGARRALKALASGGDDWAWHAVERLAAQASVEAHPVRLIAVAAARFAIIDPTASRGFVMEQLDPERVLDRLRADVAQRSDMPAELLSLIADPSTLSATFSSVAHGVPSRGASFGALVKGLLRRLRGAAGPRLAWRTDGRRGQPLSSEADLRRRLLDLLGAS